MGCKISQVGGEKVEKGFKMFNLANLFRKGLKVENHTEIKS